MSMHPLTYEELRENNFWTDLIGTPTVLNRFVTIVSSPRNMFMQRIASLGKPFFENQKDMYSEHVTLGCFYRPKSNEIIASLLAYGLGACTDLVPGPTAPENPTGIAGFTLDWFVAGYVDENTRLLYIGNDINSSQFITEFVLVKIDTSLLEEGEDIGYTVEGPNNGEYDNYQTPSIVQNTDFYGNIGKIYITQVKVDLNEPCPENFCGTIFTGIPNSNIVDGVIPWPAPILEKKCELFPCAKLDGCDAPEEGICPTVVDHCNFLDDWTFKVGGQKGKGCGWVGKIPEERCLASTGAKEACKLSCCVIG